MSAVKRRDDLQRVRGLAIVFVLLFHFFPKIFRNGFAGVDIFFVLSGYLMQLIYADRTVDVSSALAFYKRRFIRLLPLYFLTLLATTVAGRLLLLESDFGFLAAEARWALALASNVRGVLERRGYFDAVADFSFLLHTWSLALELQFYALAPLLFVLLRRRASRARILFAAAVAAPSLALHLLSAGSLSFEFLLSRVWQFQVGAISAMLTLSRPFRYGDQLHFLLSLLLVFFFVPADLFPLLTEKVVRIFATLLAAVLFAVGASLSEENSTAVAHSFLAYAGDVSYVLYLVHWPVILFYKYVNDVKDLGLFEVLCLLGLIVAISCFVHHYVELPLLADAFKSLTISVLCFGLIILVLISKNPKLTFKPATPVNLQSDFYWHASQTAVSLNWTQRELIANAIKKNSDWDQNGVRFMKPPGCEPNGYPPLECAMPIRNRSVKAFVAGNSFTYRAFSVVYETLKDNYSELKMITASNCELFVGDFDAYEKDSGVCGTLFRNIHNNATEMQPDIVFLVSRYLGHFQTPIANLTTDTWVANALKHLEKLSRSTKKIVIASPLHRFKIRVSQTIARQLHNGQSTVQGVNYPYAEFEQEHKNTVARLRYIVEKCPNCVYFDMQAPFCDESGLCATYNRETFLAYISDDEHISYRGNEVVYPSLKRLVDDLVKELKL